MAFSHGKNTEVVVDQFDITELFKGMDFGASVDTAEKTTFRKSWKEYEPGMAAATVDLDGFYDVTRVYEVTDRIIPAPFLATVGPAGLAVGALARLLAVDTTNVTETAGIADMVLLTWALTTTSTVGFGYALSKPDTAVVGSTNGAAVDTGAAVPGANWVFHAHLHAISATNVILKVQDSADGSTGWTDITGVTSGALTAVGAVRVTGTGTTRRYLRAVSTFVGGASTGRYTVAFARTAP